MLVFLSLSLLHSSSVCVLLCNLFIFKSNLPVLVCVFCVCVTKISCRKNKIVEKQQGPATSFVYSKTGNCLCDVNVGSGSDATLSDRYFL